MFNLPDSKKNNPLVQRMLQVFALQAEVRKEEQRMGIVTRREILLKQLSARGFTVTAAQRRLVEACNNKRTLDRWLGRIVTATSARAVFAPPRPRTPRSS